MSEGSSLYLIFFFKIGMSEGRSSNLEKILLPRLGASSALVGITIGFF